MSAKYQRLLVPVDGTAGDLKVLTTVAHLTHSHSVAVTLIYVVEVQQSMPLDAELPDQIEKGEVVLHRAEQVARRQVEHKMSNVTTELLQARTAGAAIVDEAIERQSDAIVMAAKNHRKHGKTTLGETVGYVLRNAPCEVVLIRQSLTGEGSEEDLGE
jgi:nucleotide-binding universal stress UspA family protein